MKNKKKIWWLLGAAAVILTAATALYQDVLLMYVAPQIPLGRAVASAITSLEARYQESPLPILLRAYDPEGQFRGQVELSQDGSAKGQLEVQADLEQNQLAFRGTLPEAPQLGSLSIYLDPAHMALTSDALLQGGCYGITYDSFRQDLQQIPLVRLLVPEAMVSQWEESLRGLQTAVTWNLSLPELPQIPVEQLKVTPMALWLLRGRARVQELEIGGRMQPCWKVDYRLHEKITDLLWQTLTGQPMPQGGQIRFGFYLYQDALVGMELHLEAGDQCLEAQLRLGPDAKEDDFSLDLTVNGNSQRFFLGTRQGRETIQIGGSTFAFGWDGEVLTLPLADREPLSMTLTPAQEGFQIQSDQLWGLIQKNPVSDYRCTVTVTRGQPIQPPEYKNLDTWSVDDLLIFLNGVWSLIQPKIG